MIGLGQEMEIIVTYRRTSRLSMRIGKRGEVRVSAPYGLPKKEVQRFIDEHREWMEKAAKKTAERMEKRDEFFAQLPLSTRKERAAAVARLDAIVAPLVQKYSDEMGASPSAVGYRATISRWGSCATRTRRIHFSLYLLLLPTWCIEHVVVHELAHLLVPNHSPRFYAVMDRHFPRWREARRETRRLSRMEAEE